jgi:integrase
MLTEVAIRQAKAKEKPYRLSDQGGLYLEVSPIGSKYWRYKYRISTGAQRIEKRLALGVYPEISLKNARELHREAHALVSQGGDPSLVKLEQKALAEVASLNTFGGLGEDWFATKSSDWSPTYTISQRRLLDKNLLPLHDLAIDKIAAPELLGVLRVIESRGALETARRTNQVASKIFDHAIAMGAAEINPAIGIKNALKKPKSKHHAAILDPSELAFFLRSVDNYVGTLVVQIALMLTPLLLVRPGELRHMEWGEVSLEEGKWLIPAAKTKRRRDHFVPLASQAVSLIAQLKPYTGEGQYVFPSARGGERAMSENAVLYAMRGLGITKEEATPHGFRATARTLMEEQLGIRSDLIEHQLAHVVRDATGEAYNRTRFFPERIKLMQRWADYLEDLKEGGGSISNNVSIFRKEA